MKSYNFKFNDIKPYQTISNVIKTTISNTMQPATLSNNRQSNQTILNVIQTILNDFKRYQTTISNAILKSKFVHLSVNVSFTSFFLYQNFDNLLSKNTKNI